MPGNVGQQGNIGRIPVPGRCSHHKRMADTQLPCTNSVDPQHISVASSGRHRGLPQSLGTVRDRCLAQPSVWSSLAVRLYSGRIHCTSTCPFRCPPGCPGSETKLRGIQIIFFRPNRVRAADPIPSRFNPRTSQRGLPYDSCLNLTGLKQNSSGLLPWSPEPVCLPIPAVAFHRPGSHCRQRRLDA